MSAVETNGSRHLILDTFEHSAPAISITVRSSLLVSLLRLSFMILRKEE